MAQRFGESVPAALTMIGGAARNVPLTLKSMEETVELLSQHHGRLERFPLYRAVIGEGRSLIDALTTVDAQQEAKRLKPCPSR